MSDEHPAPPAQPIPAARVRAAVVKILGLIAPEADPTAVPSETDLRRELDLDSIDFQRFLIGVARELGRDVPDREAGGLTSLAACEAYFGEGSVPSRPVPQPPGRVRAVRPSRPSPPGG